MKKKSLETAYAYARERYAELGIDTDKALKDLDKVSISLHCWQADDVGGFERTDSTLSGGGIQVTGNYPGKARNIEELRNDLEKAYSLIPGKHRFNMHAIYGDFGKKFVDRDAVEPKHFKSWIDWANEQKIKIDFNSSLFSHVMADSGYTLSSREKKVREFWIEHVQRCREIAAYIGKEQKGRSVHNIWIPDGSKDVTVNRLEHRKILKESLDTIFEKEYNPKEMADAIESKLFGIGSESYVVGSHEFYMGYGFTNNRMICLDMGHFHPTESIADKISSTLLFSEEVLLHVSRGIRWDSDHVVIFNDDLIQLALEIVRGNFLNKVNIGLDFFDASINRIGAYVVGTRAAQRAFLFALLEPTKKIREYENKSQNFEKLALMEVSKDMPFGIVWDYYCASKGVLIGEEVIDDIQKYEKTVLAKR